MNNFARGLLVGSIVGTALGLTGVGNSDWMKKKVWKPSRQAIKRASKVMNEVASMM